MAQQAVATAAKKRNGRILMVDVKEKIPDGTYPEHILLQIADGLNIMAARDMPKGDDLFSLREEIDYRRLGEVKLQTQAISSFERSEQKKREKALERFKLGMYHVCEKCNGTIEAERRIALPPATTCIRCNGLH